MTRESIAVNSHTDDHDLGLRHDLPRLLGRRSALGFLLGAGAMVATPSSAAGLLQCVVNSRETAGPFPADGAGGRGGSVNVLTQEGIIRQDLRPSFNGMTPVAAGVPLDVALTLVDAADGCSPLAGRAVYLWHCDAVGNYSLYDDGDRNYLRGVGISDEDGVVRFTTIFPGCYDGRWPHFHFEVFTSADQIVSGRESVLTSQISLPEADCVAVYEAESGIYSNGSRHLARQDFNRDMIFEDNSDAQKDQQMLKLTGDPAAGFRGTCVIGLA
ncbi:intradiol ring-cleavage dioxygenase [Donghicola tyrosinivorans]|uniref:Protocatechuate 3,4-dioxygenase beta subunit n=1 Tax=Donghicola tyrosinivorans TaxID=1652492 RepID=A0A2T0WJN2_9RHOB|nr:intradiol ring-cleavage dioxygenase [Donghicola tyrosinivorans]PRY86906.1 protocatechuate 3,4-dioxygenase beta subunit [Donghicola tyrosinivorans]